MNRLVSRVKHVVATCAWWVVVWIVRVIASTVPEADPLAVGGPRPPRLARRLFGTVALCSRGRPGYVTGFKFLPHGWSFVGIGLDDGSPWSSRSPRPASWEAIVEFSEAKAGALRVEHAPTAPPTTMELARSFWNCRACTCVNDPERAACYVCGTQRPHVGFHRGAR